jgi:fructosamine-3-kinase
VKAVIEAALREALDDPALIVRSLTATGGGCISHASRAETSAGSVFVKWNADGPEDLFLREADGLREMAAAAIPLAIPRVFGAWGPGGGRPPMIVMEHLEPGGPSDEAALGVGLAALHRRTAPQHGFAVASYCGATPQDNTWTASWTTFYATRRLDAIVRRCEKTHGLAATERHVYDQLIGRLSEILPMESTPSLIHGDLWGGNVLWTARGPALVDPACAYADREMELGMMTLFGGFGERFWRAYEEAWPLPDGWRERNALYQLYHVLNHYALFGGHYRSQALALARRYV